MGTMRSVLLWLLAWAASASAPTHVSLSAAFVPAAKPGQDASVAVSFKLLDPDVRINEEPAPRLKLDPLQTVLLDKQPAPARRPATFDPAHARYLDPVVPVAFPVALSPGAARGLQTVKATVSFFYCSKREGWCRKGVSEVEVPVSVP